MNIIKDAVKEFVSGGHADVIADEKVVYLLQAIVTIAQAYIEDYTGPGGDEIAPMETIRMLALACLQDEKGGIAIHEVK